MDDLVQRALAKWPNVPAISGWLALSEQGAWLLTNPSMPNAFEQGLSITNQRILRFINANYQADAQGRYFFQNGPQKAFVTLQYTPWVYFIYPTEQGLILHTHTGLITRPESLYVDDQGRVLINSDLGVGVLSSTDAELFSQQVQEQPDGQLAHEGLWFVPEQPNEVLPSHRLHFRAAKGCKPGITSSTLNIEEIDQAEVATRFCFNPLPDA